MNNDRFFPGVPFEKGMSIYEYAKIHAPEEIPEWFQPSGIKPLPLYPSFRKIELSEDREIAKQWMLDPCYDLPKKLAWFQKEVEDVDKNRVEVNFLNNKNRYFQWREFFAKNVLKSWPNKK